MDTWRANPLEPPFGPRLGRAGAFGPRECLHTWMSPTDFLNLTSSPPDGDWGGRRSQAKIDFYAARMAKKSPPASFPVPWLTFAYHPSGGTLMVLNHEGRHRAAAAIKAGFTMIPVSIQWGGIGDMRKIPEIARLISYQHVPVLSQHPARWWKHPPMTVNLGLAFLGDQAPNLPGDT